MTSSRTCSTFNQLENTRETLVKIAVLGQQGNGLEIVKVQAAKHEMAYFFVLVFLFRLEVLQLPHARHWTLTSTGGARNTTIYHWPPILPVATSTRWVGTEEGALRCPPTIMFCQQIFRRHKPASRDHSTVFILYLYSTSPKHTSVLLPQHTKTQF